MPPKKRPTKTSTPTITESMTLGDLGRMLGIEPAEVVAFLRHNLSPCAHDHASLSAFQTTYTCRVDGSFYASTCDEHADYAPCPKCGAKSRRSGIRTKSG